LSCISQNIPTITIEIFFYFNSGWNSYP